MDRNLYGRHSDYGKDKARTSRKDEKGVTTTQGKRSFPEIRKVQIRSHRARISGTDHLRRTNSNGRRKIDWYQGVASANNCETSSLISRICKFLLEIYWSLHRNRKTNKRVNTKKQAFRLD